MRLLDARGRLFGKFSLVDGVVGAGLAASGLVAYLALAQPAFLSRFVHRLHDEPAVENVRIDFLPTTPFLLDQVDTGDVQRNPSGRLCAEVIGKTLRPSAGLMLDTSRVPPDVWIITLRLGAKRGGDGVLKFGETQIKPGNWFCFEPSGYVLEGVILSVRPEEGPGGPTSPHRG